MAMGGTQPRQGVATGTIMANHEVEITQPSLFSTPTGMRQPKALMDKGMIKCEGMMVWGGVGKKKETPKTRRKSKSSQRYKQEKTK